MPPLKFGPAALDGPLCGRVQKLLHLIARHLASRPAAGRGFRRNPSAEHLLRDKETAIKWPVNRKKRRRRKSKHVKSKKRETDTAANKITSKSTDLG